MSCKGRVCMAVGRVLIAVINVGIVLKICMQHTDGSKSVYQCCTTKLEPMLFGVEAGVFGIEAFTHTYSITFECTAQRGTAQRECKWI